jgi:peroxiredoxin
MDRPASSWEATDWFNSEPLHLEELKGQVVLVRWWTGLRCPFCMASAPALNEFFQDYSDQGLVVVGFYHHKSNKPVNVEDVKKLSGNFGFQFPVAIDYEWKTLKNWWLKEDQKRWTSVTFLVDKKGIIRHIHPGGQYVRGDSDYIELKRMIEKLLKEKS